MCNRFVSSSQAPDSANDSDDDILVISIDIVSALRPTRAPSQQEAVCSPMKRSHNMGIADFLGRPAQVLDEPTVLILERHFGRHIFFHSKLDQPKYTSCFNPFIKNYGPLRM